MSLKKEKSKRNFYARTKRGDTIVEVMFAMAVFCFVAVLAISSMNLGLGKAEGTLELTTVRNEINAQAEAIRFVAQAKNSGDTGSLKNLWEKITGNAVVSDSSDILKFSQIDKCDDVYNNDNTALKKAKAFVLNIRNLQTDDMNKTYISVNHGNFFKAAPISSRIVYNNGPMGVGNSTDIGLNTDSAQHTTVSSVEGMWDLAVKDRSGAYYDFYIQACWYPPNSKSPTKLDTVIRIYNKDDEE